MEPAEQTVLKPDETQGQKNLYKVLENNTSTQVTATQPEPQLPAVGQQRSALGCSPFQLPAGTEPQRHVNEMIQITEADMKKVYLTAVEYGLKKVIGEEVNIEAYVDEVADELGEYMLCDKKDPDDIANLQTMMINVAVFALAVAAGYQATVRAEIEKRQAEKEKRNPKRTIGEAAQSIMTGILSGTSSMRAQAGEPAQIQTLERSTLIKQYLNLNSTVCINGTNYEVKRAPLSWDGEVFSGPHGPVGNLRYYTLPEAIFNDMIVPVGAPKGTPVYTYGRFTFKDVDYELLSQNATWMPERSCIIYSDPQVTTLSYRYELDHAISLGHVRRAVSPYKKMFTVNGILYGIKNSNVEWEAHSGLLVYTKDMIKSKHTVADALGCKMIEYLRSLS